MRGDAQQVVRNRNQLPKEGVRYATQVTSKAFVLPRPKPPMKYVGSGGFMAPLMYPSRSVTKSALSSLGPTTRWR
jgi:hypothetical protein